MGGPQGQERSVEGGHSALGPGPPPKGRGRGLQFLSSDRNQKGARFGRFEAGTVGAEIQNRRTAQSGEAEEEGVLEKEEQFEEEELLQKEGSDQKEGPDQKEELVEEEGVFEKEERIEEEDQEIDREAVGAEQAVAFVVT